MQKSADSNTKNKEFPIKTPVVAPALLQIDAHPKFSLVVLQLNRLTLTNNKYYKVYLDNIVKPQPLYQEYEEYKKNMNTNK